MMHNIWAFPLQISNFNIVVSLLGGFISLFGLISYFVKENYYLSEECESTSPQPLDLFRRNCLLFCVDPSWNRRDITTAECNQQGVSAIECRDHLDAITLNFSRLVLGVQLVLAGVQLPSNYLKKEWKLILLLVGPGMTAMWIATSLLIWAFIRPPSFLHALAVGACVTPTDPVLSAVIVKGKFADHNIPKDLQNLIIAESGTNDGLAYPFLFFALYLIKYVGLGAVSGGAGNAMGLWFGITWGYIIILSIGYGAVVGCIGKELLHWAEERNCVDRESFLVFAIALALFVIDYFCNNSIISIWKLVTLGALVLLLRRLPWVFGMHKWIHQIEEVRQAIFVDFFGPIGVSAVFYLFLSLEFIKGHLSDEDGIPRGDVKELGKTFQVVVWFLAVSSIVVHGLTIPLRKVRYLAPRTFSRVLSEALSNERRAGSST
ncbi:hypothetical protein AARAC_010524 [Aspergillus arachidicola]|uniref:Cation/H+ exchanger transmembrane domain-containing protein n=1 Tax=Aspergillus arachidicola TaxID=656916 RepID=A0A2G7FN67_9EURO|nr:hypothetical protein AARAC_010524 [Aspergillus arachidicola]